MESEEYIVAVQSMQTQNIHRNYLMHGQLLLQINILSLGD